MTRDEAARALGRAVLDEVDRNVPPDEAIADGDPLLDQVCGAFPHTSLPELVALMVEGIRDRGAG